MSIATPGVVYVLFRWRAAGLRIAALAVVVAAFSTLVDARAQIVTVANGDVAGLRAAITTLNASGGGTIELAANGEYVVSEPVDWWYGPNAFPAITSAITIEGRGATIRRASGAPKFRFFYVSGGFSNDYAGTLVLRALTLHGGLAQGGTGGGGGDLGGGGGGAGLGGAIYNQGHTELVDVTLQSNTARGGTGGPGACYTCNGGAGGGGLGGNGGGYGGGGFRYDGSNSGGGGFVGPEGGSAGGINRNGFAGSSVWGGSGGIGYAGNGGGGGGGGYGLMATGGATSFAGCTWLGSDYRCNGGTPAMGGGLGGAGYAYGNISGGGGGAFGGGGGGGIVMSNVYSGGGGGGVGGGGGGSSGNGGGHGGFGGGGAAGTTYNGGTGGFGGGGGGGAFNANASAYAAGRGGFGGGDGNGYNGGSFAGGGGAGMGGALFNHRGTLTLTRSTLAGNSAAGGTGNAAPGSGLGGALFNLNGTVSVTLTTFEQNTATNGAGVYNLSHNDGRVASGETPNAGLTLTGTPLDQASAELVNHQVNGTATVSNIAAVQFNVSADQLTFARLAIGTSSAAQRITLTNTGILPLVVTSIAASGDYSQSHTCTTVAVGGSCVIDVSFRPTMGGLRSGSLTITSNAEHTAPVIALSGYGGFPAVSIAPGSLHFVQPAGGAGASQTLVLTNVGNDVLHVASISTEGAFSASSTCATVSVGSSCAIAVTFTQQTTVGSLTGQLTIVDDAAGSPRSVALSGTIRRPEITISPSALDFGIVPVGGTSTLPFTITNLDAAPVTVSSIAAAPAVFSAASQCGTIAPLASCTLAVTFAPGSLESVTGTLTISDDANGSPHVVTLTGTGRRPEITLSTATLDFGILPIGATGNLAVAITNFEDVPVTVASAVAAPAAFSAVSGCATIAARGACTITVTFSPSATGVTTGTLTITGDANGSPHLVTLTGTGKRPEIALSTAALDFGILPVGATAGQPITITNLEDVPVTVSSVAAAPAIFSASSACTTIAPRGSCTIAVAYSPSEPGPATGTLTITDDANGSPHVVTLSGTARRSEITLSTATLDFGIVPLGATSIIPMTITNLDAVPVAIGAVLASPAAFSASSGCTTVAAHGSCTITVTFSPAAPGSTTGSLTIEGLANGSPHVVTLNGVARLPEISVQPSAIEFPGMSIGTAITRPVTIANLDDVPVSVASIVAAPAGFSAAPACATIAPRGSCTIVVTFAPVSAGLATGTLTIATTAAGSPHVVGLSGLGVLPEASLSLTSVNFGDMMQYDWRQQSIVVSNAGPGDLLVSSVTLDPEDGRIYLWSGCAAALLSPGASCTFDVAVTGSSPGAVSSAIRIATNARQGVLDIPVTAEVRFPSVRLSPQALTFAAQTVHRTSAPQYVTLFNDGPGAVSVYGFAMTTGDFAASGTCIDPEGVEGVGLQQGESCTAAVTFTPQSGGSRTDAIVIYTSGLQRTLTLPLSGEGVAPSAQAAPATLDFGTVKRGGTASAQTISLANQGPVDLILGAIDVPAGFTQSHTCQASIPAGQTCEMVVRFAPSSEGDYQGVLRINSNAVSPLTVTLTGQAVAPVTSTITLTSSANPAVTGQPVTLTAIVTGADAALMPSGAVAFKDAGTGESIGSAMLDAAGHAALALDSAAAGLRRITAFYAGDLRHAPTVVSLAPTSSVDVGRRPGRLYSADFNGDGKPDVIGVSGLEFGDYYCGLHGGSLYPDYCWSTTLWSFTNGVVTTSQIPDGVRHLAIGDFNGDGRDDVAYALGNGDVQVSFGEAGGLNHAAVSGGTMNALPRGIAAADLDADGRVDLIVVGGGLGLALMKGRGDGTFDAPAALPQPALESLEWYDATLSVADFDADGVSDIAVVVAYTGRPSIVYGGVTPRVVALPEIYDSIYALRAADITGDGRLDVIAGGYYQSYVYISGDDGFAVSTVPMPYARSLAVADFNEDGRPDLFSNNGWAHQILLGDGTGAFTETGDLTVTARPGIATLAVVERTATTPLRIVAGFEEPFAIATLELVGPAQLTQTVHAASVSIAIATTPATPAADVPVTITATLDVTAPGGGTPNGTVTFSDGSTTLATVQLINGAASTTATFAPGSHAVTASYSGSPDYNAATSAAMTFTARVIPNVAWVPAVPAITYGTSLSGAQLNATTDVSAAGHFEYHVQDGVAIHAGDILPAGFYQAVARFVPDDQLNFATSAPVSASLSVWNPSIAIASVEPAATVAGAADTTVTINGAGFVPTTFVRWNSVALATTFISAQEIRALIPAPLLASSGVGYLTIGSPAPFAGSPVVEEFFITHVNTTVESSATAEATGEPGEPALHVEAGSTAEGMPNTVFVEANEGGAGTVTVATYSSNPGATLAGGGYFFDVFVAPGATFESLTIRLCSIGGARQIRWFDGARWQLASHQTYLAATAASPACIEVLVQSTGTSPTIAQLTGTYFAAADAPDGRMSGGGFVTDSGAHHHFAFRAWRRGDNDAARLEYWTVVPTRRGQRDDDDDDGRDALNDNAYGNAHRHAANVFRATSITRVVFIDDPALEPGPNKAKRQPAADTVLLSGTGRWNGKSGYTFEARATDQGERGRDKDTMAITIKDGAGRVVANVAGTLDGGNIQSTRINGRGK